MRRLQTLFSPMAALALLAASVLVAPALAQSTTPPTLLFQATLPNINKSKFPDVAASGRTVHISANTNEQNAVYISKPDSANAFSAPEVIGPAPGQGDYSSTTITTGPDGAVYYSWLNYNTGRITLRIKAAGATSFGPERIVYARQGSEFLANLNIGVGSDNAIYVAWRVADQKMRARRSTDGGVTWSAVFQLGERFGIGFPYVATGPSGQAAIVYTAETSARSLGIFVSIWNGSGFTTEAVSPGSPGYANPSGTYDPEGNLFVAYRGLETDNPDLGLFVAQRVAASQWQVQNLIPGLRIFDRVNIEADPQGNLHLAWIANASGGQGVFYSFRPKGGAFGNPIGAPTSGSAVFNPSLAVNIGDRAYAHVVSEYFQGDVSTVRYYLFSAISTPSIAALPVVEDGKAVIAKKTSVTVRFDGIQGTPAQIRWNWDSAPTDGDNDSNGWVAFTNPMTIPLPESILASTPCSAEKLFTQVRAADNQVGSAQSDDVTIDTGINASLTVGNPYSANKAREFTPLQGATSAGGTLGDVGTGGASDGDMGYTRDPIYYVALQGVSDCSGMKDVAAGRSTTTVGKAFTVSKDTFANVLPYPGTMQPGSNQLLVRVSDAAGNIADYTRTIVLDQGKPTLSASNPGTVTATSNPRATILQRLTFSGVNVTDDRYPGRGFWGVWVANSRTQVANPATDTTLNWTPLQAQGTSGSFDINNWSLATGLTGAVQPGTYYIYVRFLDGAGNATDGHLTASVTLTQVTLAKTSLPIVRR